MERQKYRVLLADSHPIQYAAPLFRRLAQHPRLEILVAHLSLRGAEPGVDAQFGMQVAWDIPLLDGYPWVHTPLRSRKRGPGRLFEFPLYPELWRLIAGQDGHEKFDGMVVYGYGHPGFWTALLAAKLSRTPCVLITDATSFGSVSPRWWKFVVKSLVVPWLYRLPDVVGVGSAAGRAFVRSLGVSDQRIVLVPFVVDNDRWLHDVPPAERSHIRRQWRIPDDAPVVLFCGKWQPWKSPDQLLRAFADARLSNAYLVFVGEGPLRPQLEAAASRLGVADRVRLVGFVNQQDLPSVYRAADLCVVPSVYDSCPTVVCEAMLCGRPVVISDAVRGRLDLVQHGTTGWIYPSGRVEVLAAILGEALADRKRLRQMGEAARQRMETWSPREHVAGFLQAIEGAIAQCREEGMT